MEPKVTMLLAKAREGFLNCYVINKMAAGTKPANTFMVIIRLLAIELKTTPNGNPANDSSISLFRYKMVFGYKIVLRQNVGD